MRRQSRLSLSPTLALVLLATVGSGLTACAINPATGQSQLSLFTEAEEIELGAEVDREFLSNSRRYDDPALEAYVASLGHRMAAVSERPDLPWSFHIADDEIINAFALPGGPIYVTRGLLAHLESEAELAGVLGHEIGHVTARHSVNGLSRDLAITLGVAAGLALFDIGETGELVSSLGLSLMLLKFNRNQERQADQLGVRYTERAGLDPHGVVEVLRVLQAASQSQDDGWFPAWLSTHPDPDRRWQRLAEETGLAPGKPPTDAEINEYVSRLDGLVYGPDPRNGVFEGNAYIQHRDGFQMRFPTGWEIEREGQTLAAQSSTEDAIVMLLPQLVETVNEAVEAFESQDGVSIDKSWNETLGGLPARFANFRILEDEETTWGSAAFVRTPGKVVAILGLAEYDAWSRHGKALRRSMRSIGHVTQPNRHQTRPAQLKIVSLPRAMNARQIAKRYSPGTEPATIALLNQVTIDQPIPAGRKVKVVRTVR
jgi:predicted Zn-dependent protease